MGESCLHCHVIMDKMRCKNANGFEAAPARLLSGRMTVVVDDRCHAGGGRLCTQTCGSGSKQRTELGQMHCTPPAKKKKKCLHMHKHHHEVTTATAIVCVNALQSAALQMTNCYRQRSLQSQFMICENENLRECGNLWQCESQREKSVISYQTRKQDFKLIFDTHVTNYFNHK